MGNRWIEVDSICMEGKALINVNKIVAVSKDCEGTTIIIFTGGDDDYMEVSNSHEEAKGMLLPY